MIQESRQEHRQGAPGPSTRAARGTALLAVVLAVFGLACAGDPDTLLQIDVRVPAATAAFVKLHFTVGDGETRVINVARTGAADGATDAPSLDAANPDAGRSDGGTADVGVPNGSPDARADARPDAGSVDAPRVDAGRADVARPPDAGTVDAARIDAARADAAAADGGKPPAVTTDGGDADAGIPTGGAADAGVADAGTRYDGTSWGIDMRLPRRLRGPQPIVVRALDAANCAVATISTQLTLVPGTRVVADPVELTPLAAPDCNWQHDPVRGDDGAVGDAGGGQDAAPVDAPAGDSASAARACQSQSQCDSSNQNCAAGFCAAAPPACSDLAEQDSTLKDGVYWLASASVSPLRAYCDMQQKVVLCADTEGDHSSLTRDTSHLRFTLRSVLEAAAGTCKIWAVRNTADGIPLDELLDYQAPDVASRTCTALGFKADVSFGACPYGSDPGYTDCGYGLVRPFYKWSNNCTCGGMPNFYEKEGVVFNSHIPWDATGAYFSRCAVR